MISLGVIASGLVGSGPPPEPPTGNLKILMEIPARASSNFVEGYDLCGLAPSLDMITGTCSDIYQAYRVVDGVTELDALVVMLVDVDHAICFNYADRAIYITPVNANESILDAPAWEATCTLNVGVTVSKIDLGPTTNISGLALIEQGKFVLYTNNYQPTPVRVINVPIISYTNPTDFTTLNVDIDLDDLGISGSYYFDEVMGCEGAAVDYDTGELVLAFSVRVPGFFDYLSFTVNVDHNTGAVSNLLLDTRSALAGLSAIDDKCFENRVDGSPSESDYISNYGSVGNTLARNDYLSGSDTFETWTYVSREPDPVAPHPTLYIGGYKHFVFNRNTAINNKLVALGYTLEAGATTNYGLHCYAIID